MDRTVKHNLCSHYGGNIIKHRGTVKDLTPEKIVLLILLLAFGVYIISTIHFDPKPRNAAKLIKSRNKSFIRGNRKSITNYKAHTVHFTYNFYIDSTEVSQAEYDSLMSATYDKYSTPSWSKESGLGDNYPAYNITWFDAILFCNAKSKSEGLDTAYTYDSIFGIPGNGCYMKYEPSISSYKDHGYRLPTEEEWEYACRAETIGDFYWGALSQTDAGDLEDSGRINTYAVWNGNADSTGTQPVASRKPNMYKLYDMSGNLYEWCHNEYRDNYEQTGLLDLLGSFVFGNTKGRVIRGGSWRSDANELTSYNRVELPPKHKRNDLGFRVVRRKWEFWE